jgi:hypothetical protein
MVPPDNFIYIYIYYTYTYVDFIRSHEKTVYERTNILSLYMQETPSKIYGSYF